MAPFDSSDWFDPSPGGPSSGGDEPAWDSTGWSPVFVVEADCLRADRLRLVGFTRLKVAVACFVLVRPHPESPGTIVRAGEMWRRPLRRDDRLIWTWHLAGLADLSLVPDFQPIL
jgi:hypothetical protein